MTPRAPNQLVQHGSSRSEHPGCQLHPLGALRAAVCWQASVSLYVTDLMKPHIRRAHDCRRRTYLEGPSFLRVISRNVEPKHEVSLA